MPAHTAWHRAREVSSIANVCAMEKSGRSRPARSASALTSNTRLAERAPVEAPGVEVDASGRPAAVPWRPCCY